jgi:hypothetical protein
MRLLLVGGFFAMAAMSIAARGAEDSLTSQRAAGLRPETVALLPKADQDRVWAAYHKALADYPDLKKEGDTLVETDAAESSTPAGQSMMEKGRSYRIKVRQAMLKEDPTLGPVLTRIDELVSAMRAQRQSTADAAKPASPPPKQP